MTLECGILPDQRERPGPRALHEVEVLGQSRELQVGHPRLLRVEEGALASQAEILVGQLEPVGGADHRLDPGSGLDVRLVAISSNRTQYDSCAPRPIRPRS